MTLQIPDNISRHLNLSEKELLLELGILFFQKGILSLQQAVELSRVSEKRFREVLSERGFALEKSPSPKKELPERYLEAQQFKGDAPFPDFPVSKYHVYEQ